MAEQKREQCQDKQGKALAESFTPGIVLPPVQGRACAVETEQDPYIYQLQDTPDPELFREMFPYTETPKVAFNYRRVPENMDSRMWR